jgi:LysR family transcriptional regulator, regulatory protein for tcuABC
MLALRERYPGVRLHLVESLSGHLSDMLNARRLDLAVLFKADDARRWSVMPLLQERLFVIGAPGLAGLVPGGRLRLKNLGQLPLVLPSGPHGLRSTLDAAFAAAGVVPHVVAEIDGLAMLMDAVRAGLAATVQPGAAISRLEPRAEAGGLIVREIADAAACRHNLLVSVSDGELSPAALAARVALADVARELVRQGRWPGARLHDA